MKTFENEQKFQSNQSLGRKVLNKVPEVTIFFWIIKILSTTVGETAADYLSDTLHLGLTNTTIIMSLVLIIGITVQFKTNKYVPGIYWFSVVMISIVGTLITDNLVDHYGVALKTTTIIFSIALVLTFIIWYINEKTLSIHTIYTTKREAYYWLTILFTFALGTAAGDLVAESINLGYWKSAILFTSLIVLVSFAYFVFKLNAVWAFWIAYILTRPLGASIGDYLSQQKHAGGLGLGTMGTSAIFLVIILGLVIFLSKKQNDNIPFSETRVE